MGATLAVATVGLSACAGGGSNSAADTSASAAAHIVGLWEVKGESAFGIDDYENGAQLAVSQINAAGGVLGKPLQYDRVSASAADPQAARSAFLKAVDENPSAVVGYPSGTVVETFTRDIESSGVPFVHVSSDGLLAYGQKNGSQWLFSINPNDKARVDDSVALLKHLGAKKVGVIATDESFGHTSTDATGPALQAAGMQLGPVRYVPVTASDLTPAILAMKGMDAILSWTYPNVLALQMNQMAQNAMTIPVVSGNSGPIVVTNGLVKGAAMDNLYAITPCDPHADSRTQAQSFATAYQQKYGKFPTASATNAYDAVKVLAAAMKEAGTTTDHSKIAKAVEQLQYSDGACTSSYRSDGAHFLSHKLIAEKFGSSGASIVATYDVPGSSKGQS